MILPLCCLLWHLATPAWAQETLSLKECREMALKYNKEMAASVKQTESARYYCLTRQKKCFKPI